MATGIYKGSAKMLAKMPDEVALTQVTLYLDGCARCFAETNIWPRIGEKQKSNANSSIFLANVTGYLTESLGQAGLFTNSFMMKFKILFMPVSR